MKAKSLFLALIALLALTSCILNPTPVEDGKIHGTAAFLINMEGQNRFITDDHTTLIPNTPFVAPDSMLNRRFYIEYQIVDELGKTQTINLLRNLEMTLDSTMELSAQQFGQYANDDLTPYMAWCSGNYVNLLVDIMASGKIDHDFHMLKDTNKQFVNPNPLAADTVNVYLRHDAHDDNRTASYRAGMSFNIGKYLSQYNDTTFVNIHYTAINNTNKVLSITYVYPKQ